MADVPLLITSENASSERRVTPSWSIAHLKARLEPITGIPAACQRLQLKIASQTPRAIEAADEDATLLQQWPLQPYAEIQVGFQLSDAPFLFVGSFGGRHVAGPPGLGYPGRGPFQRRLRQKRHPSAISPRSSHGGASSGAEAANEPNDVAASQQGEDAHASRSISHPF